MLRLNQIKDTNDAVVWQKCDSLYDNQIDFRHGLYRFKRDREDKHNLWRQITQLWYESQEIMQCANSIALRNDQLPSVKSALLFHEVTGRNGFEFIAESNIRFNDSIILPNDVILVPMFLPDTTGKSLDEPEVAVTRNMETQSHFFTMAG